MQGSSTTRSVAPDYWYFSFQRRNQNQGKRKIVLERAFRKSNGLHEIRLSVSFLFSNSVTSLGVTKSNASGMRSPVITRLVSLIGFRFFLTHITSIENHLTT